MNETDRKALREKEREALISKTWIAIYINNLPLFKKCVANGLDMGHTHPDGGTWLHLAVRWEGLDIVKYLVEEHKMDMYEKDLDGCTPYSEAVRRGNGDIVEYFDSLKAKED